MASLIEQLCRYRSKKLVFLISFHHNLLTYNLSNSKLSLKLNNSITPAGSNTFLKDWFFENASDKIKFLKGLIRPVFESKQIVGKRYSVKADHNVVPVSEMTSFAHPCINGSSNIQNQKNYGQINGSSKQQMKRIKQKKKCIIYSRASRFFSKYSKPPYCISNASNIESIKN